MAFERTFVFVALLLLVAIGYGITGAVLFEPQKRADCDGLCKNITSQQMEVCQYEGQLFEKNVFASEVCSKQANLEECIRTFCGTVTYAYKEKYNKCMEICVK